MLDPTRRFPDPPPRRERIFNIPPAIVFTLTTLVLVHVVRLSIPEDWDNQVLLRLAFVPGTVTYAFDPAPVLDGIRTLLADGDVGLRQAQLGRFILTNVGLQPWTALTYGLLHADWTHIGLNGLWLLAFGSPVARRLGPRRFILFLAATTFAGALAHYLTHPVGLQPVIGASASVSGCMGAALRFMFQPQVPISAMIGPKEHAREETHHTPLQPLAALLKDRRALAFLIVWFIANTLFGFGTVALGTSDATVAWQAHIGGFLLGLLGLPAFGQDASRRESPDEPPDDVPPAADQSGPPTP